MLNDKKEDLNKDENEKKNGIEKTLISSLLIKINN